MQYWQRNWICSSVFVVSIKLFHTINMFCWFGCTEIWAIFQSSIMQFVPIAISIVEHTAHQYMRINESMAKSIDSIVEESLTFHWLTCIAEESFRCTLILYRPSFYGSQSLAEQPLKVDFNCIRWETRQDLVFTWPALAGGKLSTRERTFYKIRWSVYNYMDLIKIVVVNAYVRRSRHSNTWPY